jgi:hypothetical protein
MSVEMDFEFFDGKTLANVCKDIISNSQSKRDQLDIIVSELRSKISNINDAQALAPIIKGMLDTGVKNDEILVKLAGIAQRLISAKTVATGDAASGGITEDERKALLSGLNSLSLESLTSISIPAPNSTVAEED